MPGHSSSAVAVVAAEHLSTTLSYSFQWMATAAANGGLLLAFGLPVVGI